MRKSMKLGASALAAVAIVAGSASAASAYGRDGYEDQGGPYICGNSATETKADGDYASAHQTGYGPVTACQVGDNPIFINNQTGEVEDESYIGLLPEIPLVP
ncbi:hypothetical protein ACFS5L_04130 [Streptomyces phyllanthi]|uniref:Uncharacterized protein n=1 Tax=Streptomyces phyllanthi TaxID=1803180 RepID=A0A5N8WGY4_9ACTN|nr:hypothetical protein [Streptomyces phyllanthi]MPY46741.1 hypothetical protein [Streptomyces phyllanthi]